MSRIQQAEAYHQGQDRTGAWHSRHFAPPAPPNSPIAESPTERRARVEEFVAKNPGAQLKRRGPPPPSDSEDDEDVVIIDEKIVL